MAVIQISRIQQRRGQKPATGIPQLSSAELAWAVDTQELFIGNGSVAEGAPYVGNTKILTEHSNVFEDAVYQFMASDPEITSSVPRKAQAKLDEYVSILDFIEQDGNGDISWADTFEAAITDLCAADHKYRKVITIPNGTYTFTRSWSLQSGVILKGETRDNVILEMGDSLINTGKSSDIKLQNFTITGDATIFNLAGLTDSSLSDITLKGAYVPAESTNWHTPAIAWINEYSSDYKVDDVIFTNCKFDTVNTCVYAVQRDSFETNVKFQNCEFTNCYRGISINGVVGQSNRWVISDCVFSDIYERAISVSRGKNMLVRNSSFRRCGNGIGTAATPTDIIVAFGDVDNNVLHNCSCDRREAVGLALTAATDIIPESENSSNSNYIDYIPVKFIPGNTNTNALTAFSSNADFIIVEYGITMGEFIRIGKINITVGDLTESPQAVTVVDNYFHATPIYNMTGTDVTQRVEFNASITSSLGSIVLTYKNESGHAGELSYRVSYGSIKSVVVPMQFQAIGGNQQIFTNWNPNGAPNGTPVTGYSLTIE